MSIYESLSAGDFAKNTKKRLPICFCIDASGSMEAPTSSGKTRMEELNEAFAKFINTMKNDEEVNASADIAIVSFGGEAKIVKNFGPISEYTFSQFEPKHMSFTPLGEAIMVALKLVEIRKSAYKDTGIKYYQPWLVVLTDGEPEGKEAMKNMNQAIEQVVELERNEKLVVFNIGIGSDVNLDVLKRLSVRREEPIRVDETNLDALFIKLSSSSEIVVGGSGSIDILYNDDSGSEALPKGTEMDFDTVDPDKWCI